ncbi:DNA/RNA non-specific endonuclease, partial [Nocardia sp. NPDC058497]|uniref:DNA/RNA non-specific endonuclease n=1 Tax=Nocardia sp. NPDC058497 TaxID=3346529 RepID=UPI00365E17B5
TAPAPNPHTYPRNPRVWRDPLGLIPDSCESARPDADGDTPGPGDGTPHNPTPGQPAVDAGRPPAAPNTVPDPNSSPEAGRPGSGDAPHTADPDGLPAGTTTITETRGNNTATWTLNSDGRPIRAVASLSEVTRKAKRSSAEETAAGDVGRSGLPGDHGGHIVDHRFMLDQLRKNLFPQNGNFNTSAYKKLANEWSDWVSRNCRVEADIQLWDADGNFVSGTQRPDLVSVKYQVYDGSGRIVHEREVLFENEADQQFDRMTNKEIEKNLGR